MEYCLALNPRAGTPVEHQKVLKDWLLETCLANAQKEGYQIVGKPKIYEDLTPDEDGRLFFECSVEVWADEYGTPSKLTE